MDPKDITAYRDFVQSKLSQPSLDYDVLCKRLDDLNGIAKLMGMNFPALMTAADGLAAESGEFQEIVKKMKYQGKPLDTDTHFHLTRELGDAFFYLMVGCIGLGLDPVAVIEENIAKLDARYKNGFTVEESEERVAGDL